MLEGILSGIKTPCEEIARAADAVTGEYPAGDWRRATGAPTMSRRQSGSPYPGTGQTRHATVRYRPSTVRTDIPTVGAQPRATFACHNLVRAPPPAGSSATWTGRSCLTG